MHRSTGYYSQIAHACDSVYQQHPVSSNNIVRFTRLIVVPFRIRLSGNDPSLPRAIKQLNPDWVMVGTNFVSLGIPPERMGGFGVIWKQLGQKQWALQADGDGVLTTVYQERRP